MSILYTIGSLHLGGCESQMTMLILECSRRGWHCELFALEAKGHFLEVLQKNDVVIYDGGYDSSAGWWKKRFMLIRAFFRLCRIIRRTKPAVLHAYLPLTNFLGSLAGRISSAKRIIISYRALGTHQERHRIWKFFDRIADLFSHHITGNSQAVMNDMIARNGIKSHNFILIPNGLDISRFDNLSQKREPMRNVLGLSKNQIGIVMVANLIPYKGHVDLISALPKVFLSNSDMRIYLVGEDRGIRSNLEQLVEKHGMSDKVVFLGFRNDIPAILSAMDIYIMTSHEEGSSNALLEAMAAGLPIVATDVGGNKEALEDGRVGILVPPHNPNALASALKKLIANSAQRFYLGKQAMMSVRNRYSVVHMVNKYLSLYAEET